jgi:hypothetical protein
MPKIGRNDPCHCGSGKKYKRCHGAQEASSGGSRLMLLTVAGLMLAALIVGIASFTGDRSAAGGRVWSAEHGHWHDSVTGLQVP